MKNFIDIGFGNLLSTTRMIALVSPDSSPARRLVADARERSSLIDATSGKKTRSIIIMDSDHVILSALPTEDIRASLNEADEERI